MIQPAVAAAAETATTQNPAPVIKNESSVFKVPSDILNADLNDLDDFKKLRKYWGLRKPKTFAELEAQKKQVAELHAALVRRHQVAALIFPPKPVQQSNTMVMMMQPTVRNAQVNSEFSPAKNQPQQQPKQVLAQQSQPAFVFQSFSDAARPNTLVVQQTPQQQQKQQQQQQPQPFSTAPPPPPLPIINNNNAAMQYPQSNRFRVLIQQHAARPLYGVPAPNNRDEIRFVVRQAARLPEYHFRNALAKIPADKPWEKAAFIRRYYEEKFLSLHPELYPRWEEFIRDPQRVAREGQTVTGMLDAFKTMMNIRDDSPACSITLEARHVASFIARYLRIVDYEERVLAAVTDNFTYVPVFCRIHFCHRRPEKDAGATQWRYNACLRPYKLHDFVKALSNAVSDSSDIGKLHEPWDGYHDFESPRLLESDKKAGVKPTVLRSYTDSGCATVYASDTRGADFGFPRCQCGVRMVLARTFSNHTYFLDRSYFSCGRKAGGAASGCNAFVWAQPAYKAPEEVKEERKEKNASKSTSWHHRRGRDWGFAEPWLGYDAYDDFDDYGFF
jgi:hypothetical protein